MTDNPTHPFALGVWAGLSLDDPRTNPFQKGTREFFQWSRGHHAGTECREVDAQWEREERRLEAIRNYVRDR